MKHWTITIITADAEKMEAVRNYLEAQWEGDHPTLDKLVKGVRIHESTATTWTIALVTTPKDFYTVRDQFLSVVALLPTNKLPAAGVREITPGRACEDALARVRAAATRHVHSRIALADALDELAAAHEQAAAAFHSVDEDRAARHAAGAARCHLDAANEREKLPES